MSERRFLNAEEIADLRSKGIVAVSPYFCRIGSSLALLVYIFSANILEQLESLLLVDTLRLEDLQADLITMLRTIIVASCIYVTAFLTSAYLQSRFYFRLSLLFPRQGRFFSLGRGLVFFRLSSILNCLGFISFGFLTYFVCVQFLSSQLFLLASARLTQLIDLVATTPKKLSFVIILILLVTMLVALLYRKVGFLVSQRLTTKVR